MSINFRNLFGPLLFTVALAGCQTTAPATSAAQPKSGADKQVVAATQSAPAAPAESQAEQQAAEVNALRGELYVLPVPANARVRVMNIKPKFVQGMKLPAGRYYIEVTAPGYRQVLQWVSLESGKMKRLKIELVPQ